MADRRLDRFLGALPDAVTAAYFLTLWIAPLTFGDHGVRNGMLIMLVEFIVIHASGFLGVIALGDTVSRSAKLKAFCGFALFYLLFIAAFAYSFQAWWPFAAFGWLWVGKLVVALDARRPAEDRQQRMMSGWAMSVLFYLFGTFLTLLVPMPRFGFADVAHARLDLPGGGEWVSRPHTVIAFGVIYFGLLALSKWMDWRLPATRAGTARQAGRS